MQSQRLKTCPRCNGAGNYYHGREVVRCANCGGSGQLVEEFESRAADAGGQCSLVLLGLVLSLTGLLGGLIRLVA